MSTWWYALDAMLWLTGFIIIAGCVQLRRRSSERAATVMLVGASGVMLTSLVLWAVGLTDSWVVLHTAGPDRSASIMRVVSIASWTSLGVRLVEVVFALMFAVALYGVLRSAGGPTALEQSAAADPGSEDAV